MLYKKTLDEIAHRAIGSFADRALDTVEIYRSSDVNLTARYFGDRTGEPCYFEVALFGYKYGKHEVYIKYPNTNFFVEMYGGSGSAHGNMKHYSMRCLLAEELQPFVYEEVLQPHKMSIKVHEDNMLLEVRSNHSGDFNFLTRVAKVNNNSYDKTPEFGHDIHNQFLRTKFIPIDDKRNIAYSYKTPDGNLIIVDQSAYNFSYEGMRCFYGNVRDGIKQGEISGFERYRDGGTTLFKVALDGVEYGFYSPSRLGSKKELKPTWNNVEIEEFELTNDIIEGLGIKLAPQVAKK